MKSETESSGISEKRTWLWIAAITAAGAGLRFYHLDWQSLWLDEAYSVIMARESIVRIIQHQMSDSSPPLYYILLHLWQYLWGDSEFAVRSLSAIAGILLIPVTSYLARYLFPSTISSQTAIWGAMLIAFSPFQIYFSQETRMYSLAALAASLAIMGYVKKTKLDENGWYFIPSMAACIWLHNYGWLIWGGLILYSMLQERKLWIYHFGVASATAPWILGLAFQLTGDTSAWVPSPRLAFLWETLNSFAGKSAFMPISSISELVLIVSSILFLFLLIFGITQCFIENSTGILIICLVLIPVISAWLVSYIKPIYYPGRYEMIFHAVAVISVARGLSISRFTTCMSQILLACFLGCQLFFLSVYYTDFHKSTDRIAGNYLQSLGITTQDLVITTDLSKTPLEYYMGDIATSFLAFPRGERGWLPRPFLTGDIRFMDDEVAHVDHLIKSRPQIHRIILVVANELAGNDRLVAYLDRNHSLVHRQSFPRYRIYNQIHQIRIYNRR